MGDDSGAKLAGGCAVWCAAAVVLIVVGAIWVSTAKTCDALSTDTKCVVWRVEQTDTQDDDAQKSIMRVDVSVWLYNTNYSTTEQEWIFDGNYSICKDINCHTKTSAADVIRFMLRYPPGSTVECTWCSGASQPVLDPKDDSKKKQGTKMLWGGVAMIVFVVLLGVFMLCYMAAG